MLGLLTVYGYNPVSYLACPSVYFLVVVIRVTPQQHVGEFGFRLAIALAASL